MLNKELGIKLTGRYLKHEMFPFSYIEFIKFNKEKPSLKSFENYLERGGFPEFLKLKNENILYELLLNIINRDIVVRYGIKNSKILKELTTYLISNISKEYSNNSLKKLFNLGSVNTVKAFISYLEDSYLLFSINKFDWSLKKQLISPKKIYCVDNGLAKANSLSFSKDMGRMLENIVFINLRKKYCNIFYYNENSFECDFVIKEKDKVTKAIQVCLDIHTDNKEREIGGLISCVKKFNLKEGLILTKDKEDTIMIDNYKITIIPVWKWLLE
jgi:hypothetical protein